MKKVLVLCVAFALVLAGCSQEAATVKEAIVHDMDLASGESLVTLKIDTNLLDDEDEVFGPFLKALQDGLKFHSKQKSKTEGYTQVSLVNPNVLKGTDLWPYEAEPTLELFIDGGNLYLTTSIDQAVLALTEEGLEGADQEGITEAVRDFIADYNYELKQVSLKGSEKITLPDGSQVEAQKVNVKLDLEESVAILIYTLEHLAEHPELVNLLGLEGTSGDVQEELQTAITELQALDIKDLTASGLKQELNLDLWVADKHLVQVDGNLKLELPGELVEEQVQTENVFFNIAFKQQTWNQNKSIKYDLPSMEKVVTEADLLEKPELAELFAPESPVGFLAQMLAIGDDFDGDLSEYAFDDVAEGHWAYEYVTTLHSLDMINGVGGNKYAPNQGVTRTEFAKMVVDALGYEQEAAELKFKDASHIKPWAQSYLETAVANGILEGYNDQTLRPNATVTRSEMLTILVRALDLPLDEQYELTYKDKDSIQPYAVKYVQTGTSFGLVQGNPDHTFAPKATTSRADAAAVIYRTLFELEYEGN